MARAGSLDGAVEGAGLSLRWPGHPLWLVGRHLHRAEWSALGPQLDLGGASIRAWAWSPEGHTIALVGDKSVYLYLLAAPEAPTRLEASASELVTSLAYSPDGRLLALGGTNTRARSSADGIVRVLDLDTRAELASVEPYGWVGQVVFSPNGTMLGLLRSTTCGRGGS